MVAVSAGSWPCPRWTCAALWRRIAGDQVGAQASVQKVFNAIAQRDGSRALIDLLGPAGATLADGHVADHLGLPAVLFGGGTIEIQLNVIATRVLGLPR